ncbi:MAG: ATP-binding protein [Lachnospiraceae bacterium]|nr:ATP-binding protein [Lachnospiraceae bacterium]
MKELRIEATLENLDNVLAFVDAGLEEQDCPIKVQMQLDVAVEELYVNISHYAYAPDTGQAVIEFDYNEDTGIVKITFKDSGTPFDPTAKADPDTTLSAAERQIGGLGIYMAKKSTDEMSYEYKDNMNILSIFKKLQK